MTRPAMARGPADDQVRVLHYLEDGRAEGMGNHESLKRGHHEFREMAA